MLVMRSPQPDKGNQFMDMDRRQLLIFIFAAYWTDFITEPVEQLLPDNPPPVHLEATFDGIIGGNATLTVTKTKIYHA